MMLWKIWTSIYKSLVSPTELEDRCLSSANVAVPDVPISIYVAGFQKNNSEFLCFSLDFTRVQAVKSFQRCRSE